MEPGGNSEVSCCHCHLNITDDRICLSVPTLFLWLSAENEYQLDFVIKELVAFFIGHKFNIGWYNGIMIFDSANNYPVFDLL